MLETLEFEELIAILNKEIEALGMLPQTDVRDGEIDGLRRRIDQIRGEIYKRLTPWQRVLVSRHPERPSILEYVNNPIHAQYNWYVVDENGTTAPQWITSWATDLIESAPHTAEE